MRILLCCEWYAPSVGGVQEVMRQIAEHMVSFGHKVTVVTSSMQSRNFNVLNGVEIVEFSVSGNRVKGIVGEWELYRRFICQADYDVMLIKAAQQWTFDALIEILDEIKIPKIFIPCGFSGMYQPAYKKYFAEMPKILRKFDHLIFYASKYRDIEFCNRNDIFNYSIVPNGADHREFCVDADPSFRSEIGVAADSFLFLTVGSFTGLKGHLEIARAFSTMCIPNGMHATLILNGNEVSIAREGLIGKWNKIIFSLKQKGWLGFVKSVFTRLMQKLKITERTSATPSQIAQAVNESFTDRKIIVTDFPRDKLVQAFMASDLFVFASRTEYSPLVLFESVAAGTPFLTVDVGNALEISDWTKAGIICPSFQDEDGYTHVSEKALSALMSDALQKKEMLVEKGQLGKKLFLEKFTWDHISRQYENIFKKIGNGNGDY